MKASQIGMLGLKLVVTAGMMWILFDRIDMGLVADKLKSVQTPWAATAILVLFVQLLLTGVRWYYVGQIVGARISLPLALRLILLGQFFNQVLPSSVGGDGVRAWLVSREGISGKHALVSVICDRAAALVLLTSIVAVTLPILIHYGEAHIPSGRMLSAIFSALTILGLLFLLTFGQKIATVSANQPLLRPVGTLLRDLRFVLFTPVKSLWVIGLTLIVQAMVVFGTYFCARALNIDLNATHVLMLPLIMLISSIPVSFAGWGVRESAMVAGLGFASVTAPEALTISVMFGLTQIVIGLPGIFVALTYRAAARKKAMLEKERINP